MANVNVTYEEMTSAANTLKDGQGQIEEILQRLSSTVDTLIASGFQTGTASGQFGTSYQNMDHGLKQAIPGISGMADFLTAARDAMQSTDEQLASGLNG
jgi:WXG100 family type VII secretion target